MRQILSLCSRLRPHPKQQQRLAAACADFTHWDDLLRHAEEQGMGPLLHSHLTAIEVDLPDTFFRGLRFLCLRHQQANTLLMQCLHGLIEMLKEEGINCLVLKGAVLCKILYPDVGMRPMRDIDLLLAKEDVEHAHAFLLKNGFYRSTTVMPDDHYHLSPLYQPVGGMQICVELHHDLFPDCPPYYQSLPFADLYQNAQPFDVNGATGYALATEEMLWHLYQHGFHAPLTYEPYKLISSADIVSLVEEKFEEIDWGKIESIYPELFNALPVFHYLTPWNEKVLEKISIKGKAVSFGTGEPFNGWPRLRLSQQKERGFLEILHYTFLPGQWWLMVYYAPKGRFSYLWCKFYRHPKHVFWWVKLYWHIFITENLPSEDNATRKGLFLPVVKHLKQLSIVMYRKFQQEN